MVEERVPIGHLTGEADAEGTSDAVVIRQDTELVVADLKYGMGVEVSPERNRQCRIYALGVIHKHNLYDVVETIRIVIFQPRVGDGKPKEWLVSMVDLLAFGEEVKKTCQKIAQIKHPELHLVPTEKGCRFCKAKAICPALKTFVGERVTEGFENLDAATPSDRGPSLSKAEVIGRAMDGINLIEIYMKGIQSACEIELLAGHPVLGIDGPYKLVEGRKGNRAWIDEDEVLELFKTFRMKDDDVFKKRLISPTDAEALLAKPRPGRWLKVKKLFSQAEGSKHVANAKDKRPAIVMNPTEGFEREDCEAFF